MQRDDHLHRFGETVSSSRPPFVAIISMAGLVTVSYSQDGGWKVAAVEGMFMRESAGNMFIMRMKVESQMSLSSCFERGNSASHNSILETSSLSLFSGGSFVT